MSRSTEIQTSRIEATYKAREVEGVLDLYFYRPIGFRLAEFFAHLKMTPAAVTLLAGICGIIAGHLYYYRDLRINIAGMVLHVCSNVLDNADGQLARLTRRESRKGRIIDSIADHLVFVSIYLHLVLIGLDEGSSPAIWCLAIASGLRSEYRGWTWRQRPWDKLLLALYLNFTRQQEMLAPQLKKLRETTGEVFDEKIPAWLEQGYRNSAGGMFKWWGLLMTNSRMLVLFALLFLGQPIYYFWFELIPLNVLFICLLVRQEKMAESLEHLIMTPRHSA